MIALVPAKVATEHGVVPLFVKIQGRTTQLFLGMEDSSYLELSEVRKIIDQNYQRAEQILKDNEDILHTMADALMKYETIDKYQLEDLMDRKPVRDPQGWDDTPPPSPDKDVKSEKKEGDKKGGKEDDSSIDGAAEQN